VAFCPLQNTGSCRGAHPNAAELTTCGNRESSPGSRCFVKNKRPLCQFSSKRLKDNWYSGLLSSERHRLSGRRSPDCRRVTTRTGSSGHGTRRTGIHATQTAVADQFVSKRYRVNPWPLHDILLFRGLRARIYNIMCKYPLCLGTLLRVNPSQCRVSFQRVAERRLILGEPSPAGHKFDHLFLRLRQLLHAPLRRYERFNYMYIYRPGRALACSLETRLCPSPSPPSAACAPAWRAA